MWRVSGGCCTGARLGRGRVVCHLRGLPVAEWPPGGPVSLARVGEGVRYAASCGASPTGRLPNTVVGMSTQATFYYDFSSPYSYFAAHRVDELMPVAVRWQVILFGGLTGTIGKTPWSLQPGEERDSRMRACEVYAAGHGLPLAWPRDWPLGTYSLLAVKAAVVADELGRQREFALEAFRQGLGRGNDLTDLEVIVECGEVAEIDAAAMQEGVERPDIKARVREVTGAAVARGVTGIPTVAVGDQLFWGNDRLEEAAAAAR